MYRPLTLALLLTLTACGGDGGGDDRVVQAVSGNSSDAAQHFNTHCANCHEVDGGGKRATGAPAIANLPAWYITRQLRYFRDGIRGAHEDDSEGRMMAANAAPLDDARIDTLAAFITSLPAASPAATLSGDATRGKDHYNNVCSACHGSDGRGNETLGAPNLVGIDDWYLARQYRHFRDGIRGGHPEDRYGVQMIRIAPVLDDDNAVRDVLAYLASQ